MHRFSLYIIALGLPLLLGGSADVLVGKGRLQSGDLRMAKEAFERALVEKPQSGRARVGLAQVLALEGQCDEALRHLESVRGERAWTTEAILHEAVCLYRTGDESAYLAALQEALVLKPRDVSLWFQMSLGLLRVGDIAGAREALETVERLPDSEHLTAMLEAAIAFETGAPDADYLIHRFIYQTSRIPSLMVQGLILDTRRWLALGLPVEADRVIERVILMDLRNVAASAWRAEAYRMMGKPEKALGAMLQPAVAVADSPLRDAIRIRALVDLGRYDEARAWLERHPIPMLKQTLASRWYLAIAVSG